MNNQLKFTIIILIISLSGCANKQKEEIKQLFISDKVIDDSFSSIISSYEVIGLDDQIDAYFEYTSRLAFTDSLMIFALPNEAARILIFDNHGNYIRSVGKKGRGPGEIIAIDDITFNEKDKTITVFQKEKAIVLDMNGELIDEFRLDFKPAKVVKVGSGYLIEKRIATNDSLTDYEIRLVDGKFRTIDRSMPLQSFESIGWAMEGQQNRANINQEYGYYFSLSGDTILHLIGDSFKPAYKLTYDKKVVTLTILKEGSSFETFSQLANQDLYRNLCYYEIGNLRLVHFYNNQKSLCYVYDEQNNTQKVLEDSYNLQSIQNNLGVIVTRSLALEKIIDKSIDPGRNKCSNPDSLESIINRKMADFVVIMKIKFKEEIL